jgi:hypothetical protein
MEHYEEDKLSKMNELWLQEMYGDFEEGVAWLVPDSPVQPVSNPDN